MSGPSVSYNVEVAPASLTDVQIAALAKGYAGYLGSTHAEKKAFACFDTQKNADAFKSRAG